MSVTNYRGEKVTLSRVGKDQFWKRIHEHYAHDDQTKWKYLAMLSLHETAGWPLEQVGMAFNHHKGHVLRSIQQIKAELRKRFDVTWDGSDDDPEERETETIQEQWIAAKRRGRESSHENRPDETLRSERGALQPPETFTARVA